MMGAGKSAVGRLLARRLSMDFVDTDHEIRARTGVSIPTIFELEGEVGFRAREERMVEECSRRKNVVVATGGGAVLSASTRACLRERGITIYLHAKVADLWQRTRHDRARPLLACEDPKGRLAELLAVREPLYREAAHHVVETGRPTIARLVETIVELLVREHGEAWRVAAPADLAIDGLEIP